MLQAFLNIWKITELRTKLLFTFGMLAIYRLGFFVPLPGVSQEALTEFANKSQGAAADLMAFVSVFTGGSFSQSTVFGLGIMPYISASIILQLLTSVLPSLQQLQKEGPTGRQKIQEYTRYLTVGLSLVQSVAMLMTLRGFQVLMPDFAEGDLRWVFWLCGIVGLTGGAVFLMWLGEQIDKYGIGNGASLIITAGIVTGMPIAIKTVADNFSLQAGAGQYGPMTVVFLLLAFVGVVAGAIIITQGQRRIPIQQAKHTRGRRVYGGQRSYLPLRVNHGGVMPIIFASALMMFPSLAVTMLSQNFPTAGWLVFLSQSFEPMRGYLYIICYIAMIYFFAYFWTSVQFQPKEMASNLRDHGSFVPGLRPGPRTADYLETVMERITYVGAGFLAVIAVIPMVVATLFEINMLVTMFLGGTGLLIVVSVMLDFVTRIDATLMMRNYPGFMGGASGRSKRMRGATGPR